jgi:hypothetical protein
MEYTFYVSLYATRNLRVAFSTTRPTVGLAKAHICLVRTTAFRCGFAPPAEIFLVHTTAIDYVFAPPADIYHVLSVHTTAFHCAFAPPAACVPRIRFVL